MVRCWVASLLQMLSWNWIVPVNQWRIKELRTIERIQNMLIRKNAHKGVSNDCQWSTTCTLLFSFFYLHHMFSLPSKRSGDKYVSVLPFLLPFPPHPSSGDFPRGQVCHSLRSFLSTPPWRQGAGVGCNGPSTTYGLLWGLPPPFPPPLPTLLILFFQFLPIGLPSTCSTCLWEVSLDLEGVNKGRQWGWWGVGGKDQEEEG